MMLGVIAAAAFLLGACQNRSREGEDCPGASGRPSPSGFCVPRWLSLKSNEVRARRGPGTDYPALWIYRARGLPVQVVAETADWRRICDPDGGAVWVHRSMVDGRRMVMAPAAGPVPLLADPKAGARPNAILVARGLANLERCEEGWCKVEAGGASGWAPQSALWGTAAPAQCR